MSKKLKDGFAEAEIIRGEIVIRLAIKNIPQAYKVGVDLGVREPGLTISDPKAFALEVVHALNDEDEEGTTSVHRLFDDAFDRVIDSGAEGVEELPSPEAPDAR